MISLTVQLVVRRDQADVVIQHALGGARRNDRQINKGTGINIPGQITGNAGGKDFLKTQELIRQMPARPMNGRAISSKNFLRREDVGSGKQGRPSRGVCREACEAGESISLRRKPQAMSAR